MTTTQVSMAVAAPGARVAPVVRVVSVAALMLRNGRALVVVAESLMPVGFVLAGMGLVMVLLWGLAGQVLLPTVTVGGNDRVAYAGTVTRDEARALGAALQAAGYFHGSGKTVRLIRDERGTMLSVFVAHGQWKDEAMVAEMERVARVSAASVGGLPIRIHLLDMSGRLERELVVGAGNR